MVRLTKLTCCQDYFLCIESVPVDNRLRDPPTWVNPISGAATPAQATARQG